MKSDIFRRHAVTIYFVLTIVLTWGCMALAASPGGFPLTEAQLEKNGALVYIAMLIGPTGAGLLMTGLLDGKAGFRALRDRLFRWRVGLRWYAVALLTAPVLIVLILLVLSTISADFRLEILSAEDPAGLVISSIAIGLAVGLFEELGWTGFAVPNMNAKRGVLANGLILGLVWGLWHFPPFWEADTFSAALPLALLLGRLFSWLPPYRVLLVWMYDRTESVLLTLLMHAGLVAGLSILVPAALTGTALLTWILSLAVVLWVVVGTLAMLGAEGFRRLSGEGQPAVV